MLTTKEDLYPVLAEVIDYFCVRCDRFILIEGIDRRRRLFQAIGDWFR